MSRAQLYDSIGATYTVTRRTEPRIAAGIWAALGFCPAHQFVAHAGGTHRADLLFAELADVDAMRPALLWTPPCTRRRRHCRRGKNFGRRSLFLRSRGNVA